MSNRSRGDYLEHQTRDALAQYGWLIIRSGGSLGCADLVALRVGKMPLLVQCKVLGKGRQMPRVDPAERMALFIAARESGARAIIATRYRPGYVALLELPGPNWTTYPMVDELHVPARPGKAESNDLARDNGNLRLPDV